MPLVPGFALSVSLAFFSMVASLWGQAAPTVRLVTLLPATRDVEIEIQSTHRIAPQTQVVTGPDRIVIDFPGATPGTQLRTLAVNRGGVKSVRSGLFRSNPPVTRVVLDLNGPLPYQVFRSGSSVIIKLGAKTAAAGTVADALPSMDEPPAPPPPILDVHFQNGVMSVHAERTNLAAVLTEIRKQTGGDIAIPAGAEQEPVIAKLGPAPARDVITALLNGSRYNFVMIGWDSGSSLSRLILTPKGGGVVTSPPPAPANPAPAPPVRIPQPQPGDSDVATSSQQSEQEVPEQSGDQANDNPAPAEGTPNQGTPPPPQ
jgi:hypothetical protein